jgi:hypothetical protein
MQHLVAVADADQAESPMSNHPPPLESPYGPNAWPQPAAESIEIDDTHALMTRATFDALMEYSSTVPSGVYPGKMWRRNNARLPAPDVYSVAQPPEWLLCWFERDGAEHCRISRREVLLV